MQSTAPTKAKQRFKTRVFASAGTLVAAALCSVAIAQPSMAAVPVDGPGATNIIQSFAAKTGASVPFRTGNAGFGEVHIKAGGSTKNTANHELTTYAKQQWQKALGYDPIVGRFPGSQVFSAQYTTGSGIKRTMCVVVDTNDYTYANQNYGYKGIITAFWINGHHDIGTCNSSPG